MEGREKSRRIDAGGQTHEQGEAEKGGHQPGELRRSDPQVDPGDRSEQGQPKPDQDESGHEGQEGCGSLIRP